MNTVDISRLTDDELWERTRRLAKTERGAVCDLVEHLAEIDRRNLSAKRERGSLYEYCVNYLGYSEAAAFRRIRAARAIRMFPPVSVMLREGRLTLEGLVLLHPFLKEPDAAALVQQACGLRTWELQALLAGRNPTAPKRDVIRICGPAQDAKPAAPVEEAPLLAAAAVAVPSAAIPKSTPMAERKPAPPSTYRFAFTADTEFHRLLLRSKALLRHKYPDGRLEGVLRDALIALLKRRDRSFGWRK